MLTLFLLLAMWQMPSAFPAPPPPANAPHGTNFHRFPVPTPADPKPEALKQFQFEVTYTKEVKHLFGMWKTYEPASEGFVRIAQKRVGTEYPNGWWLTGGGRLGIDGKLDREVMLNPEWADPIVVSFALVIGQGPDSREIDSATVSIAKADLGKPIVLHRVIQ